MRTSSAASVLLLPLALSCVSHVVVPDIPKQEVPSNITPEVRISILRLYSDLPQERADAARRLGTLGEKGVPAVPFLSSLLRDRCWVEGEVKIAHFFTRRNTVGYECSVALAAIGGAGHQALIQALKHANPDVKATAVYGLGEGRVRESLTSLMEILGGNEEISVREVVPVALEKIHDASAITSLIAAFARDEPFNNVWSSAGAALSTFEDPMVIDGVIKVLGGTYSVQRRDLAAQILGDIGGWRDVDSVHWQAALAALTKASTEPDPLGTRARDVLQKLREALQKQRQGKQPTTAPSGG